MRNKTFLILIVAIILVGSFIFMRPSSLITGNDIVSGNGEMQKVILSEKNLNYYPNTFTVEAGKPVELTLDNSVKGCLRSFIIRDLGVSKYAKALADKIIFTPTKKGSFTFTCSMGMGYGTIIVI